MNANSLPMLTVDSLEIPGDMTKQQEEDYRRRFSMLLLDRGPCVRRGPFVVRKAHTAEGRPVAVCSCSESLWGDGARSRWSAARMHAMLRAEQAGLARFSLFLCYPAAYGLGVVRGEPVLIEDWIEGVSLEDARRELAGGCDGSPMSPLHVALIGVKLFRLLEMLEEYGAAGAVRGISGGTVLVEAAADELSEQLENRDFNVRLAVCSGKGEDPSDILLRLLGGRGGEAAATRDERDALACILEHGRRCRYESASMKLMLQRWIRVHDSQRLRTDGSAPYSYPIDPRVFIPRARLEERPRLRFGSRMIAESLDSGEGDAGWVTGMLEERSGASRRQCLRWWAERNFMAIWVALMLAYTVAVFAVGWMLYP